MYDYIDCGAIHRQASQVNSNRYANAVNIAPSKAGHKTDTGDAASSPTQSVIGCDDAVSTVPQVDYCTDGLVYENKYELDSLVNVLQVSETTLEPYHTHVCLVVC